MAGAVALELARAGVRPLLVGGRDVGEIGHFEAGSWTSGPDPERRPFGSWATLRDPDGNTWVLQEGRGASGA